MKTLQEIFDIVSTHLLRQGVQARDDLSCRYRMQVNDVTTKCAVGCLIPDSAYNTDMEGNSIVYVRSNMDEEGPGLVVEALALNGVDCRDYETMDLLEKLQTVHDTEEPHNWPAALEDAAIGCRLNNSTLQL